MQTVNDYGKDAFNGDVGRVLAGNPDEQRWPWISRGMCWAMRRLSWTS
jgi:ATP-dependent exoDNAse (exonuclease V) alpha subunit